MSRTDKDRPYEVRAADPGTKNRYWSEGWTMFGQVEPGRWEVDEYHVKRPPREIRRNRWKADRARRQHWEREVIRGDHEAEPPEGRTRHGLLWDWE